MANVHPLTPASTPPRRLKSINPANGEEMKTFLALTPKVLFEKIARADEVFAIYRRFSFAQRADILLRAADILEAEKSHWGRLMSLEMGKTLQSGVDEAAKCIWVCRYFAEHASRMLTAENVKTGADESYVCFQPLGLILAVMPWNFPFWQVFRFAAPALMAGNVVVLKHASNVPQCALAIEEIFRRAGLPEGVFQTVLIGSDRVEELVRDPRVRAVTLTGSDEAGASVASQAGKNLKKAVLELGGSDPFIVMPSAHMEEAVNTGVTARMINNGQSCVAAKRFFLHEAIAEAFLDRFVRAVGELRVGNPLEATTQIGPLATADIRDRVARQVDESVRLGARILVGGKKIEGPGNYYMPTVLTAIPENAPAYHEEVFGPVALIFKVRSLAHAIELANRSRYGLGSSLWSTEETEHELFVNEIEAGMAFINGMVSSDPRLPFGGVKNSGYGRELSHFGIREFVNIKTVWKKTGHQDSASHGTE
jgi:succinate-semialdehyde dehydrogenase/glutarate-semialdehyde dehydrogenase